MFSGRERHECRNEWRREKGVGESSTLAAFCDFTPMLRGGLGSCRVCCLETIGVARY